MSDTASGTGASGPLAGYRIIEMGGIGPVPFAGTMFSDLGADVIRVDPAAEGVGPARSSPFQGPTDLLGRGRRSIAVDLKSPEGIEVFLRLVGSAHALIEGFRPGVMERMGIGPDECLAVNPKLVFGRMTGWGQDGPLAQAPAHDINYIALAGSLAHIGRAGGAPTPPLTLLADFGGGSLFLVVGVLSALLEAASSGQGQVVDAAMVDGVAMLMLAVWGMRAVGLFDESQRGFNYNDSGTPFYDSYECADGHYVSIGSVEPHFWAELLRLTGLSGDPEFAEQFDQRLWPRQKERLAEVFRTKTRAEWCEQMEGSNACFAPVLTMTEALAHPQIASRQTYVDVAGVTQPAPAPRFSRSGSRGREESVPLTAAPYRGDHTDAVLREIGLSADDIAKLMAVGAVR